MSHGPNGQKHAEFEWITNHIPTSVEVDVEQEKRGYHPAGYASGFSIKTEMLTSSPPGTRQIQYKTTWKCSGTCD